MTNESGQVIHLYAFVNKHWTDVLGLGRKMWHCTGYALQTNTNRLKA